MTPAYRASDLSTYHSPAKIYPPEFVDASQGDILLFSPSRCLHRGFVPIQHGASDRKVLHVSYSIVPKGTKLINQGSKISIMSHSKLSKILPIGRSFSPFWISN